MNFYRDSMDAMIYASKAFKDIKKRRLQMYIQSYGSINCKVCGFNFDPKTSEHYISKEAGQMGMAAAFSGNESKLYDTFDCPRCGSQCRVQEHLREVKSDPREMSDAKIAEYLGLSVDSVKFLRKHCNDGEPCGVLNKEAIKRKDELINNDGFSFSAV